MQNIFIICDLSHDDLFLVMDIHAAVLGLADAATAEVVVAVVGGLRRAGKKIGTNVHFAD